MGKHVQNPAVEALNMNSQKITSLANGTASGDAVNFGQLNGMVTGSGAANRIALWSGAAGQTSHSNLTWSSTSMEIGHGSDAAYALKIGSGRSGNGFSLIEFVGDETYTDYGLRIIRRNDGANAPSQIIHRGTGGLAFVTYEEGDILFQTNNIDRAILKGNGRFGVKTLTPNADFHVAGNSNLNGLMIGRAYGSPAFVPYPLSSDPDAYNFLASDNGDYVLFNKIATGSGYIGFRVGNNNKAVLLENGNFGFGIDDPAYQVHSLGKAEINGLKIGKLYANFPGIVATALHDADPYAYNFIASENGNFVLINKVSTGSGYLGLRVGNVNRLTIDESGVVTINNLTAIGTVITDASGNISRANHFDYSGTLTASRTMTLGSNSFTLDASGAASSPATMLILKGKESSFSTRFIDYQNESGVTSFRMSATSSQVTLAALNSHDLRIEGVNSVNITTNLDRGFLVMSSGAVGFHSGLSTAPSSPATASMWWLSDRLQIKKSAATANIATVEDDLMGNATQVITASTHTLTGQDYFTRYSASSNAIVVTLGDSLLEGKAYRVRCTGNGTNTVTFNAGGSNVFYVDEKSTTTLTTLVTGAGGTGIEAPNRILTIVRRDNVIWIF